MEAVTVTVTVTSNLEVTRSRLRERDGWFEEVSQTGNLPLIGRCS